MSPDERDRIMARLLAAWPTPPMPDSTAVIWNEHLAGMDAHAAMAAMLGLEKEKSRRPSIADFHEAYTLHRQQSGRGRSLERPDCGICDNGFVEVVAGTIPTVQRCPSGCKPMTAEQRQAHEERATREYDARRDRERVAAGRAPLDFTEPGSRHDAEEPF